MASELAGSEARAAGAGLGVCGFWPQALGVWGLRLFGFRAWGLEFGVFGGRGIGFEFRDQGLGLGFKFRVLGQDQETGALQ